MTTNPAKHADRCETSAPIEETVLSSDAGGEVPPLGLYALIAISTCLDRMFWNDIKKPTEDNPPC